MRMFDKINENDRRYFYRVSEALKSGYDERLAKEAKDLIYKLRDEGIICKKARELLYRYVVVIPTVKKENILEKVFD